MNDQKLDAPRLYLSPPHLSGKEIEYVSEALNANWVAPMGPQLDAFEAMFRERIGVEHAVAVSSGTAALHLAMRHLQLKPDDEVLCSTFTFCGSANPIRYEQAIPVFIDSEWESWNMDPNLLEEELRACDKRGKLPRAVVVVDILGHAVDIDTIRSIASRYDVPIVEDAAQALGSTYKDRSVGSSAFIATFSFNGNKIITTSAGGMLCTNDAQVAKNARFYRAQARDPAPYYLHSKVGFNYALSNLLAAVGMGQMEVLDDRVAALRRIRDYYVRGLGQLNGLRFMPEAEYTKSNCWLTSMLIDPGQFGASCGEICEELEKQNIEARRLWKPLHTQPVFAEISRHRGGDVAGKIFEQGICLPSGSAMTDGDLDRVIEAIKSLHA
jgi:pyridoxal phosphate-dependent aminotransferase EpsN